MDEKKWSDDLIDDIVSKIEANCIVPIIGPGVFHATHEGRRVSVQEYVVRKALADALPEELTEESVQAFATEGFKGMTKLEKLFATHRKNLRGCLWKLFKDDAVRRDMAMDGDVLRFLGSGNFPLVLTTCYFNWSALLAGDQREERAVVAYQKEQQEQQDVPLAELGDTLRTPTLFHLFGMLGVNKPYVITENDFLSYLHYIQDTNHYPKRLKAYLQNRHILTLGCEIPDWTFRFLLYSLKERGGKLRDDSGAENFFVGGAVASSLDEDLGAFLSDINYFSYDKVNAFLRAINDKLSPEQKPTLFLSVNSEEYDSVGRPLAQLLSRRFDVWFFPDHGKRRYWRSIKEGIERCRYFMPVTTSCSIDKLLKGGPFEEQGPDREIGLVTELRLALEHSCQQAGTEVYCIPYLVGVSQSLLKNALMMGKCKDLWDLFYPTDGCEGLTTDIQRLTADQVLDYIKQS